MTAALAAVIVMVAAAGWRAGLPGPATLFAGDEAAGLSQPAAATGGIDQDEAGMSEAERHAAKIEGLRDLLAALQQSPGNLQPLLQALGRLCGDPAACEALLAEALAGYPDQAFAALVARTLERMPAYEREMQSLVMSTEVPARERYARIHALRERTLGIEETALAFGQERAWAEYQFAFGDLQQQAASMPQEARIAALEALREQAFGPHAAALAAVEGPFGAYERELAVSLAGVEDPAQRAAITDRLRQRHFDADTRVQLAARDEQLATQQQQVGDYRAEAEQLRRELDGLRATLPEDRWNALYEQRMTELRLKHFPAP